MAATPALFQILQQNDVTIFELQIAKLNDVQSIKAIGDALLKLVATPECQKLIIDLAAVQSMGSAALSQLVIVNRKMRERFGQLRVCSLQPGIAEVFRITHLNRALAVDESRRVSMATLTSPEPGEIRDTLVVNETMTLGSFESLPTEEVTPPDRD